MNLCGSKWYLPISDTGGHSNFHSQNELSKIKISTTACWFRVSEHPMESLCWVLRVKKYSMRLSDSRFCPRIGALMIHKCITDNIKLCLGMQLQLRPSAFNLVTQRADGNNGQNYLVEIKVVFAQELDTWGLNLRKEWKKDKKERSLNVFIPCEQEKYHTQLLPLLSHIPFRTKMLNNYMVIKNSVRGNSIFQQS